MDTPYTIQLDKEHDSVIVWAIIATAASSDVAVTLAKSLESDLENILHEHPDTTFKMLVDIDSTVTNIYTSMKQRQVYLRVFANSRVSKVALIVQDDFIRMLVGYYAKVLKRTDTTKCFEEKKEGMDWLLA